MSEKIDITAELKDIFSSPLTHLRTGISYMLPFILIGGILSAVGLLDGRLPWAGFAILKKVGDTGMHFFVPMLAAFTAYSIAAMSGLAPGFILGYLAQQGGSGFLGAMLAGYLAGYTTAFLVRCVPVHRHVRTIWSTFAPSIVAGAVGLLLLGLVNGPVAAFSKAMAAKFSNLDPGQGALVGLVMGLFDGIDYGGPISKIASIISTAAWTEGVKTFFGARIALVMVPPLSLMLAALLAPKCFTKAERSYAKETILVVPLAGFTEFALPIALNDYFRCTAATLVGCIVAGVVAGYGKLELLTPILGLPSWFFVSNPLLYGLSILAGVAVAVALIIIIKTISPPKYLQEEKMNEKITPEIAVG